MSVDLSRRYDDLVFCGGGTRCVWQGGFLHVFAPYLAPTRRINAVSGGVLSGLAHVTGQGERLVEIMAEMFDALRMGDGNMSLRRRLRGGPLLIHEPYYREMVTRLMAPPGMAEAVAEGPEFTVHLARASRLGNYATLVAYALDLQRNRSPHVTWPRRMGARPLAVDMRTAARAGRIVDLTVAAASSPPAFSQAIWDGQRILDGGVADNAACPPDGHPLVLLTRPYEGLPNSATRSYVRPSRAIGINKIDFTDSAGLHRAWAQGEADARAAISRARSSNQPGEAAT